MLASQAAPAKPLPLTLERALFLKWKQSHRHVGSGHGIQHGLYLSDMWQLLEKEILRIPSVYVNYCCETVSQI